MYTGQDSAISTGFDTVFENGVQSYAEIGRDVTLQDQLGCL